MSNLTLKPMEILTYNRTIVELKYGPGIWIIPWLKSTYNRTIVELKYLTHKDFPHHVGTYNRTIVELKFWK